jgi:hypothetical protein
LEFPTLARVTQHPIDTKLRSAVSYYVERAYDEADAAQHSVADHEAILSPADGVTMSRRPPLWCATSRRAPW